MVGKDCLFVLFCLVCLLGAERQSPRHRLDFGYVGVWTMRRFNGQIILEFHYAHLMRYLRYFKYLILEQYLNLSLLNIMLYVFNVQLSISVFTLDIVQMSMRRHACQGLSERMTVGLVSEFMNYIR